MKKILIIILFCFPLTSYGATTAEMIATIKFLQERVAILQYQLSVIRATEAQKPIVKLLDTSKEPVKINGRDCGLLLTYQGKCVTLKQWKEIKGYQ